MMNLNVCKVEGNEMEGGSMIIFSMDGARPQFELEAPRSFDEILRYPTKFSDGSESQRRCLWIKST